MAINVAAELLQLLIILVQWPLVGLANLFGFLWKKEKDVSNVCTIAIHILRLWISLLSDRLLRFGCMIGYCADHWRKRWSWPLDGTAIRCSWLNAGSVGH